MGQILLLKNADFSANAVSIDSIYDVVRACDTPTPHYPMTKNVWKYNTKAVTKKTTVYAVSIVLPELASTSSPVPSKELNSLCCVGVYDGSGSASGVSQVQKIDISNIINAWIDGDIADGSRFIIQIPTPLVLYPGQYFAITPGVNNGDSANRSFCYARNVNGSVSGDNGYLGSVGSTETLDHGMANDWYGVEED